MDMRGECGFRPATSYFHARLAKFARLAAILLSAGAAEFARELRPIMNTFTPERPTTAPAPAVNRSQPDAARLNRKGSRFLTSVSLIAIAAGLAFGFWSVSRQLAPEIITASTSAEERNSALAPQKSVAVLPFENLSENDQNAFLADGVQDDILSALSKIADLKVISGTSVSSYAPGSARDLPRIGEAP